MAGAAVFVAGKATGNMSISSNHATNGAFGEVDNHADVVVSHTTGSFAGGKYEDAATSYYAADSFIYKLSLGGVPETVYTADTMPSDGIIGEENENNEKFFSSIESLANFELSGDTNSIVAVGTFIGSLSFPIGAAGDTTILTNRRGRWGERVFALKINGATMQGEWAVQIGWVSTEPELDNGRIHVNGVVTTASGDVIVATKLFNGALLSPPMLSPIQERLQKLDGATGAVIWERHYPGLVGYDYGLQVIGEDIFLCGRIQKEANGTDVFSIGQNISIDLTGATSHTAAPFVAKLDADGSVVWAKTFGRGYTQGIARSVDGMHIYAMGYNEIAWATADGPCILVGNSESTPAKSFLLKLNAADGACVWAKDIGWLDTYTWTSRVATMNRPIADLTHVYATWDDDRDDVGLARWSTADGTMDYVTYFGGTGSERANGMVLGPTGQILLTGFTSSGRLDFSGVAIKNLVHHRHEAVANDTAQLSVGSTIFVASLSHATPWCLECSGESIFEATITTGACFINGVCRATGDASQTTDCHVCDAAISQTVEQPDLSIARCRPPAPSAPPQPRPPPTPPSPPLTPGSRNARNVQELTALLDDATVDRIVLAPGSYLLNEELSITRSVTLEAALTGTVVLDAQAAVPSARNGGCKKTMENSGHWSDIPSNPTSYNVQVGDKLVFHYNRYHNIYLFASEWRFKICDFTGATLLANRTLGGGNPYELPNLYEAVVTTTGPLYIGCGRHGHCSYGQKVTITAANSTSPQMSLLPTPPPPLDSSPGALAAATTKVIIGYHAFYGTCSRVLHITPPSAVDIVELIGLNITGGDGKGAAAYIELGQVAFSQCDFYDFMGGGRLEDADGQPSEVWRDYPIIAVARGNVTVSRCKFYRTERVTHYRQDENGVFWTYSPGPLGWWREAWLRDVAAVYLTGASSLKMNHCSVSHDLSALVMDGGIASISHTNMSKLTINGGKATVSNSEISLLQLWQAANTARQGAAVFISSTNTTFTEATLNNCSIHNSSNENPDLNGGGLLISGANTIAALDSCRIYSNRAKFNGGGLSVQKGASVTTSRTIIRDNAVTEIGGANNIDLGSGHLYYRLPTPPGYWLPSITCIAHREPCDKGASGDACRATPCSTTSGTAANGWTPSNCKAPLPVQPCEWQTAACSDESPGCLLGHLVHRIAVSVDIALPYECSAGYVGSNESVHQGSSICAGACPAGFYCPKARTLKPVICPAGHFCPEGTVSAIACPEGKFGASLGLSKPSDCIAVSPGYWTRCPGSTEPIECGGAPFFCPGNGSSRPLAVDSGYISTPEAAPPTVRTGQAPCPAGAWCSAGIMIACEKGYYTDSLPPEQRTSQAICLPCPAFSTTAAQGSSDVTQCLVECDLRTQSCVIGPPVARACRLTPSFRVTHRSATRASTRARLMDWCTVRATA